MMHQVFTGEHDWMTPMCIGNTNRSTPTKAPMPKRLITRPSTPAPETMAVLAAIARQHLDVDTLETSRTGKDFQEQAVWCLRDALVAAYNAGRRHHSRPSRRAAEETHGDIVITTKPTERFGDWATGRIGVYRFEAKVYPEHSRNADYAIERSRISKMRLCRLSDDVEVFAWDRGLDTPAADAAAQVAVNTLTQHLADLVFGPAPR